MCPPIGSRIVALASVLLLSSALAVPADETSTLTEVRRIWDVTRIPDREKTRIEFPDLIRFQDAWYSAFREGEIHGNHPTGRVRIIRSSDAEQWESVALLEWEDGDVRDPKLSITAEGQLMLTACVWFVSLADHLEIRNTPKSDLEKDVLRQSVTWLSPDGRNWSSVHLCRSGVNTWRWSTTWHNGMGHSIGYHGRDWNGRLYRTRDGKSWEVLADDIFPPEGYNNETSLVFGPDNTAYCLLRRDGDLNTAMLGISQFPYDTWDWKDLGVGVLGGPKLIRLTDGRLVAAGRLAGRVTLYWVDPDAGTLTEFAKADGTSYPGLVEHEGTIWVSYEGRDRLGIDLGKVKIPDK